MSKPECRGSIAWAAVVVALLSSRAAVAQIVVDPGPTRQPNGLMTRVVTGAQYDVMNQALAERRLRQFQAKLKRDAERGNFAAADRDAHRINDYTFRIAVDEWLIRKNLCEDPGYYPMRTDRESCAAIAYSTRTALVPVPSSPIPAPDPQPAGPTIPITIINAESGGANVVFAINGVPRQATAGSRQNLNVPVDSQISYDSGGSLGRRRYRISPGLYEFRSTAEGWALYKLPDTP